VIGALRRASGNRPHRATAIAATSSFRQGCRAPRIAELLERLACFSSVSMQVDRTFFACLQAWTASCNDGVVRIVSTASTSASFRLVQANDADELCSRLPVDASTQHCGARRDRHLQPFTLLGLRGPCRVKTREPERSGVAARPTSAVGRMLSD